MKYSLCIGLLLLSTTSVKAPGTSPLASPTVKRAQLEQQEKKGLPLLEVNTTKIIKKSKNRFGLTPLISTTFLHSGLRYKLWSDRTITRRNVNPHTATNGITHVFHPNDNDYKEVYENIPEFSEK